MIEISIQPNGQRTETQMRVALCGFCMERRKEVVLVEVKDAGVARRNFWGKLVAEDGCATGKTWSRWLADREEAGYEVIYQPDQLAMAA